MVFKLMTTTTTIKSSIYLSIGINVRFAAMMADVGYIYVYIYIYIYICIYMYIYVCIWCCSVRLLGSIHTTVFDRRRNQYLNSSSSSSLCAVSHLEDTLFLRPVLAVYVRKSSYTLFTYESCRSVQANCCHGASV